MTPTTIVRLTATFHLPGGRAATQEDAALLTEAFDSGDTYIDPGVAFPMVEAWHADAQVRDGVLSIEVDLEVETDAETDDDSIVAALEDEAFFNALPGDLEVDTLDAEAI